MAKLGCAQFLLRNRFLAPRTAKSQLIWIKFCTHLLLYGINLWADWKTAIGVWRLQMNCCDFGSKLSEWRWGRVLSWKISEFCSVGGARSQNSIFRILGYTSTVLRTAYMKQFYPKPMVPMESRDSEGVPFVSLESLLPGIWQI